MTIALIGYDKMGHMLEQVALQRGHNILCRVDARPAGPDVFPSIAEAADILRRADVAVEFTTPATAPDNIRALWDLGLPVVCGTTGWDTTPLIDHARQTGHPLIWTSNYSLGVNILFALNKRLAELMRPYPQYTPSITETHHIHKLDAPSGTAKTLALQIGTCPIRSVREGEVPGIHTVTWDSPVDTLSLTHSAKSREGFALGAILAAEWLPAHRGFHTMNEVLNL